MDAIDALTTRRCYKEPWPIETVIEYFNEQRGRQFDPEVVEAFMRVVGAERVAA